MSDRPKFGEWQPIESAPHGVDVLVYWPETRNNQGCKAVALFYEGKWQLSWLGEDATSAELAGEPTHWMPIDLPY